jgi:hypothetical protein
VLLGLVVVVVGVVATLLGSVLARLSAAPWASWPVP